VRGLVVALLWAACVGPCWWAQAAQAPVEPPGRAGKAAWAGPEESAIQLSIDRARAYLWSKWSDGHWPEPPAAEAGGAAGPREVNRGGKTALCAYALLSAGEKAQDSRMRQTLAWLAATPMNGTYARALRAHVWSVLGPQSPYRARLDEDVKWLLEAADRRARYDYTGPGRAEAGRYDNSNTHLAVLGVWAGLQGGVQVPAEYWRLVRRHWTADQNLDGGWSYAQGRPRSYGSMTAAGLGALFICLDALGGADALPMDSPHSPIARGMQWLEENFSLARNPGKGQNHYFYYLYALQRVGLASGYRSFAGKNWYALGARELLARQLSGGGWGDPVETSFALLFLSHGRRPVMFQKLQYPGTWNSRPRDLANLTRWASRTFERHLNWQIARLDSPISAWHDAPVLYVSGRSAPRFTQEHLAKLRRFVREGGLIFSEAAGSRAAFNLGMQKAYAWMFPQYPLKRLPDDHPLFSRQLQFQIGAGKHLAGVSNGVRLLAIHAPAELSAAWQGNDTAAGADSFRLAANVYLYATGKDIPPRRGRSLWPRREGPQPGRRVTVARIKHEGNWDPEPLAWKRFAILMGNAQGLGVDFRAVEAAGLDAAQCPLAVLSGTDRLELTDGQVGALRDYLTAGGTLLLEAAGGSRAFAAAAEGQLRRLLPEAPYGIVSDTHPLYRSAGPAIERVDYRRGTRTPAGQAHAPRLRGATLNGRLAVLFSPDDLTAGLLGCPCWAVSGYEPDSAFALMRNILLYAAGKTLAPTSSASSR